MGVGGGEQKRVDRGYYIVGENSGSAEEVKI